MHHMLLMRTNLTIIMTMYLKHKNQPTVQMPCKRRSTRYILHHFSIKRGRCLPNSENVFIQLKKLHYLLGKEILTPCDRYPARLSMSVVFPIGFLFHRPFSLVLFYSVGSVLKNQLGQTAYYLLWKTFYFDFSLNCIHTQCFV